MEQTETIFASAAEAEGGGAAAAPEAGGWTLHCQHGKNKHSVVIDPALTVLNLKERLQEVTGVPTGLMKLMTKFMLKDADVISSTKLKDKAKDSAFLNGCCIADGEFEPDPFWLK